MKDRDKIAGLGAITLMVFSFGLLEGLSQKEAESSQHIAPVSLSPNLYHPKADLNPNNFLTKYPRRYIPSK